MSHLEQSRVHAGILKILTGYFVLGLPVFAFAQSSDVPRRAKEAPSNAARNELALAWLD